MSTGRLEAFSDGVLAVAITLLVLDIRVPEVTGGRGLGHALAAQWPAYVAYVTSFMTIGIIWINHHAMIGRLRSADHSILMLNLLLLLSVGVLPFATSLMAHYLRFENGEHLAASVYGGTLLVMGVLFAVLQRHILLGRPELLSVDLSQAARRGLLKRNYAGVAPYVLATALAPVSPFVTLAICFAVAAFYALPFASAG